jgi:hypothetical protein
MNLNPTPEEARQLMESRLLVVYYETGDGKVCSRPLHEPEALEFAAYLRRAGGVKRVWLDRSLA